MNSTSPSQGRPGDRGKSIDLLLEGPASDGASVGREASGRAVFCAGGLPGELVRVELTDERKRFARGRAVDVLQPHSERVEPRCPTHALGCGGCDLAHATAGLQAQMKQQVVADSLVRIGRVDGGHVHALLEQSKSSRHSISTSGYRTTVRVAIHDGRAGYRRRASRDVVWPIACGVVHPRLEELLVTGRYDRQLQGEVQLRVSVATGERIAMIDGDPALVDLPSDVVVVSRRELREGRPVSMIEEAAGRRWQVSAGSFFQAGPSIASALVDAVGVAAGEARGSTIVDAYAGIGLFGGTIGAHAEQVLSVEQSASSSSDARVNLAHQSARVIEAAVEDWRAVPADLVIADPARRGLGPRGVESLDLCRAPRFVLVSCDTGSLGRDVGLLAGRGYTIDSIQVIDAFPDTSHVETVVGLRR